MSDRHLRVKLLRHAYLTRDNSIPWGLTPIERVGMPTYLEQEYRHHRLDRWCQLLREVNEWRSYAAR